MFRFVVFLSLLFALFSCSDANENKLPDNSDQIITLSGKQQRDTVFLKFIIPKKTIRAQRTGKLERLVENPEFEKNSLLVQFDNYDAFVGLSGEKEALKEDLTNQINQFPKSLNPVEKKWRDFASKLTPDKIMPDFPVLEFKEEAELIEESKIEEKYDAIQKKELALQTYFQLSPEDGFITQVHAHTDDYVKKGKTLITYHPKKIRVLAEASFPLTKAIQKQIKTDLLVRIPVDKVVAVKKKTTTITYSLTLKQNVESSFCQKYVIINQDQHVFRVPKDFVGKDQKVHTVGETPPYQGYFVNGEWLIYSPKTSLKIQKPTT